jgi:phosphoglycerate kinase
MIHAFMIHFIDEKPDNFWQGKRVLVRVGFDMGKNFGAMEAFRIDAALETINFLLARGAFLVLLNHNGRPEGKVISELSNAAIAKRLEKVLQKPVPLFPLLSPIPPNTPLALLENLRFDPGEEAGDMNFARQLASYGDIYVNEAFPNDHRGHASMVALPSLLPHFGGLHLKRELNILGSARDNPLHPFALIIGGVKAETKIDLVKQFWNKSEALLMGGILANTFLHQRGIAIGKSLIDSAHLDRLNNVELTDTRLHLPVDVRVAKDFEGKAGVRVAAVGKLLEDEIILDIGPDTEILFDNIIKSAKMIIWNGPLGKFEIPEFAKGTENLLKSLAQSKAQVITGGGETLELLERKQMLDKFHFISTGGGAMLTFLAGKPLPALEALN